MVMAPANTGKLSSRRKAVISTDQTKRGNLCMVMPGPRMLNTVVIKLMAPKILLIPDKCRANIPKSTAPPEWLAMELSGGYHLCFANRSIPRHTWHGDKKNTVIIPRLSPWIGLYLHVVFFF